MRSLEELVEVGDPALPMLESWVGSASNEVELVPAERAAGERALSSLQVTARSMLGAVALHTAGLLVDGGWLRILGSGGERLPRDLATWNGLAAGQPRLPGAMLIADDAVGGFFAINGDAFDGPHGDVWYLAPDTLVIYPFLFTEGEPIAQRSRRSVPIEELWGLHAVELPRRLAGR